MLLTALLVSALAAPASAAPAFVKEGGIRISSAVLQGGTVNQIPTMVGPHFYYVRNGTAVFSGAAAAGGQSFTEEPGVRLSTVTLPQLAISSVTGLSVLALNGGGFRMLYAAISTNAAGDFRYSIHSATSADAMSWANDTGTRISVNGGAAFVGHPSLVKLGTGRWRLYYTANIDGSTTTANRRLFTALSADQGRNFTGEAQLSISNGPVGEVAAIQRTDGRIRLFYTAPLTGETTNSTILSALTTAADTDGSAFSKETGVRLATNPAAGFLSSPYVLRSTETWRWKLYYNYTPFAAAVSTAEVFSASAFAPDPTSISPETVFRTSGAQTFTVKGESFSGGGMGFVLSHGAVNVPGALVSITDDQTASVAFDLTNQDLGFWDLTVTNANGAVGTLSNALKVDFAGGTVLMTDNLLRPRDGTRTRADVMTFNDGHLTVKIYTPSGGLVTTLFDSYAPAGTTTLFWDGKTASGHVVASGLYVLRAVGQKIDSREKIVVIK
jgi:hypothetical protein